MRVVDESGVELNADFSVEADGEHLALVLESSGGKTASGGVRNAQYLPALELLLARLAALDAVLLDALVDSSRAVRDLTEDERRVLREAVWLGRGVNVEELRRRLTGGQGRIGQRPGAPKAGNNSKRLRLRLRVPGYDTAEPRRLALDLARGELRAPGLLAAVKGVAGPSEALALAWAIGQVATGHGRLFTWVGFREPVGGLLDGFGAEPVPEHAFRQLASTVLWEAPGAPSDEDGSAPAGFTEDAFRLLGDPAVRAQALDVLRVTHLAGVDRRVLWRSVGLPVADDVDVLLRERVGARLAGGGRLSAVRDRVAVVTEAGGAVREVPLDRVQDGLDDLAGAGEGEPGGLLGDLVATAADAEVEDGRVVAAPDDPAAEDFAVLDGEALRKYRREQGRLRRLLLDGAEVAACALCGRDFPAALLVAAHVKRRSEATEQERRDLRNVAMLACSFGCDRLFELGYVTVDEGGAVVTAATGGPLDAHLRLLEGRMTYAFHERSARYFEWHRRNVFRGRPDGGVGGVR